MVLSDRFLAIFAIWVTTVLLFVAKGEAWAPLVKSPAELHQGINPAGGLERQVPEPFRTVFLQTPFALFIKVGY